jgi:ATP-dependent Lon protease
MVSAGLALVIIPQRNLPDVKSDLPAAVRGVLQTIPGQRLEEVSLAMTGTKWRCMQHVVCT